MQGRERDTMKKFLLGMAGGITGVTIVLFALYIWNLNVRISNIERFLNQAIQNQKAETVK